MEENPSSHLQKLFGNFNYHQSIRHPIHNPSPPKTQHLQKQTKTKTKMSLTSQIIRNNHYNYTMESGSMGEREKDDLWEEKDDSIY
jgi:hypothetical protein